MIQLFGSWGPLSYSLCLSYYCIQICFGSKNGSVSYSLCLSYVCIQICIGSKNGSVSCFCNHVGRDRDCSTSFGYRLVVLNGSNG